MNMKKIIPMIIMWIVFSASDNCFADVEHAFDPVEVIEQEEAMQSLPYKKDTVVFKKRNSGINLFSENNELYDLGLTNIEELSISRNKVQLYSIDDEVVYKASTSHDVWETIEALEAMEDIIYAEPDYLYYPQVYSAESEPVYSLSANSSEQWYIEDLKFPEVWEYIEQDGGSPETVIAVIDTGVDYSHPDLSEAMWVNENEIPGNGIDDDGNGYIDDIYGCSTVSDERFHSGDPMDDHGHGTHVSGIIGMQPNNGIGGTGAAYGCRIMAVKAGQSTGVFSATDIAEAIDYAYSMGADIINMSFGSYAESNVIKEALETAFSSCVLVASAGNDEMPNLPSMEGRNMYPAAYDWVIGVMAHDEKGVLADFSNYEYERQSGGEYELSAPGCGIYSTLPGDRYAKWSGTSMAAPLVSSAAALMRSEYSDKDVYSTRFIMSQLISASEKTVTSKHGEFAKLDLYSSMTKAAKPDVHFKEFYLFDSFGIDPENDEDGTADAGEIIDLGIKLKNYWGTASNVTVKIDSVSEGGLENPYVEIETDTVEYGEIGIFNENDNGLISTDGEITGVINPFRIKISPNTPNDTVIKLNITVNAKNGDDVSDTALYESKGEITFAVQSGREISGYITEDMTLTKEYYWILNKSVMIPEGIKMNIEPGTQVQFYSDGDNDVYIQSDGELNIKGTEDEPVQLFVGAGYEDKTVTINGNASLSYVQIINPNLNVTKIDHTNTYGSITSTSVSVTAEKVERSRIGTKVNYNWYFDIGTNEPDSYDCVLFDNITARYNGITAYRNCVFLINRSVFGDDDYISWETSKFENMGFWKYNNRRQVYSDIKYENGKKIVACAFQMGRPVDDPSWSNDEITRALKKRYGEDWKYDINAYIAEQKGGTLIQNEATISDWFSSEVMETEDLRESAFVIEFDESVPDEVITGQVDLSDMFLGFNENNAFLNRLTCPDTQKWMKIVTTKGYEVTYYMGNNYWGTTSENLIEKQITDQEDSVKLAKIIYEPYQKTPSEEIYPFVVDVSVYDSAGNKADRIGMEPMSVRVTFNRDMDTQRQPDVYFGPAEPYTDFVVNGDWINSKVWEGTYDIKPSIGDGIQYFRISGAAAADDTWLVTGNDSARFMFEIVTTGAESMQLRAEGIENSVELEWNQEDFDTIAGYNIYRSDSPEGEYKRINSSVISPDIRSYIDMDVEPGKSYYYRFTVVQTDLTESGASQTAKATVYDSIAPVIEHMPENLMAAGSPKSISATVTDNIAVEYVLLNYRETGTTEWKTIAMNSIDTHKYIALIPGSDTIAALEYYIEASDGTGTSYSGTETEPYVMTVTETPVIYNITPAVCDLTGGDAFVITGVNFSDDAKVYIGDKAAENITVEDGIKIVGMLPANSKGEHNVHVINKDGSEYVLKKGIEYKNMIGSILLESQSGKRGENITIFVKADIMSTLSSASFSVNYDINSLEFIDVQKSISTDGFMLEYENGNGTINVSMKGGEISTGSVLCRLNFKIKSSADEFYTRAECINAYINGSAAETGEVYIYFESAYTATGKVSYYSCGTAVEGADISLGRSCNVKTDASGVYRTDMLNRGTYVMNVSKNGDQRNITSYDAALTLKNAVGKVEFSDAQEIAADVNTDGCVNAADAALILQMASGKLNGAFPGSGKEWSFVPNNYEYELTEDSVIDIEAIELGDPSGNWGETSIQSNTSDGSEIYYAPEGSRMVSIPVPMGDPIVNDGIIGIDVEAEIDNSIISSAVFRTGDKNAGYIMEQNSDDGMLKLAMMSDTEIDMTSEGVLFLDLELVEPLEEEVTLDITYVMMNERRTVNGQEICIRTLEPKMSDGFPVKGEKIEVVTEYIDSDIDMTDAAMYTAGYSADGRLLYVFRSESADGLFQISREVPENADKIKVFVWNDKTAGPIMRGYIREKEDN